MNVHFRDCFIKSIALEYLILIVNASVTGSEIVDIVIIVFRA